MRIMLDSITAKNIPTTTKIVAGYVGFYATNRA